MSYAVYAALYLAVLVNFAGYLYLLAYIRRVRPIATAGAEPSAEALGRAVVAIVPTHNEASRIQRKIENLLALEVPMGGLRVIVADGGSTDGTVEIVARMAGETHGRVAVLSVPEASKIAQLNAALERVPEDAIVVVTDADAHIDTPDALIETVELLGDERVGLVGGWCMPPVRGVMLGAETAYWDKQNRFRHMETVSFSSSIVVAPFYAFRAGFLDRFPLDCVADDVFASCHAHDQCLRVVYTPTIRVTEERQPATVGELVRHKYRKTHAYTTELLRVAHRLPHMSKRHRVLLTFKLLQMFILPWSVLFFAVSSLHLLAIGAWTFLAITQGILTLAVLGASLLMVPPPGMTRGGFRPVSLVSSLFVFVLITVLLVANVFIFPFYRQGANYTRVTG